MTPAELALARQRTYDLFGRLFLDGISPDQLPQLDEVPELAALASLRDPDQAAADHFQLISVTLFPYESIFRDPSGLLGGPLSEAISAVYQQNGCDILSDADHIGHELRFMARLCAAEASAHAEGEPQAAASWHSRQRSFLSAHILTWLPPLVTAIEASGDLFYSSLANLTLDLCADHLDTAVPPGAPFNLPAAPDLAGEESGLKEIARALTTPPYSGLFLSRDAISALARRHDLPRGFGDRAQLLTNLLRTAGQYNHAAAIISDLSATCRSWSDSYQAQADRYPALLPWIRPWRERAAQTAAALAAMIPALTNPDIPPA